MSIRVFDFTDYKDFVLKWVENRPRKGRGEFLAMAHAMNVHTTLVSQIFKGARDLSLEQADALADHLTFSSAERRYFLDLVNYSRAGTKKLKSFYLHSLKDQKREADRLQKRLKVKRTLSDAEKAIFYADAIYSYIHLLTYLPDMNTVEKIAARVKRDKQVVEDVVDFLLSANLLKKTSQGLKPSTMTTHVDAHSPYVLMHHRNWRLKAIERQGQRDPGDLFYSGQLTMSRQDYDRCKEVLRKALEEMYMIMGPSESEEVYNFNFDFYPLGE